MSTTVEDVDRFLDAIAHVASGGAPPVPYELDVYTGDYWPISTDEAWSGAARRLGASCARG